MTKAEAIKNIDWISYLHYRKIKYSLAQARLLQKCILALQIEKSEWFDIFKALELDQFYYTLHPLPVESKSI